MLDIGWMELAIVAVIALLVLGPKELPGAIRAFTGTVAKARGLANEFRSSIDDIVEETELKQFRDQIEGDLNQTILDEPYHPAAEDDDPDQTGSNYDYVAPDWTPRASVRLNEVDRAKPRRKRARAERPKGRRGEEPRRTARRKVRS